MNGLSFLPPGSGPVTMPGAVPGAPGPVMPFNMPPGAVPGPAAGASTLPAGAIPGAPPAFLPPGAGAPDALPEYVAETQNDGSILLRMRNPDGTPGVVMQIVNAPKPRKQPGQPQI